MSSCERVTVEHHEKLVSEGECTRMCVCTHMYVHVWGMCEGKKERETGKERHREREEGRKGENLGSER